jgi:hypothetical protein
VADYQSLKRQSRAVTSTRTRARAAQTGSRTTCIEHRLRTPRPIIMQARQSMENVRDGLDLDRRQTGSRRTMTAINRSGFVASMLGNVRPVHPA